MFNTIDKSQIYSPYNDGLIGWYMLLPGLENNRFFYDLMNINHLTLTTNTVFSREKPRSAGFLSLNTSAGTGATTSSTYKIPRSNESRTLSGWFHPLVNNNMGMINFTGFPSFSLYYYFDNVNHHFFTDSLNGSNNLSTTIANDNLIINTWQHMTITSAGTAYAVYKNGRKVLSGSWGVTINTNTTGLAIGYKDNPFNGYIDDVRIWNRRLSDNEVMGMYLDSVTGYRESLPALNHMFSISNSGGPVGSAFQALFGSGGL